MTYMKPEMEIEKFDLIEEIAAEETSAVTAGGEEQQQGGGAGAGTDSIGNDLIIG